MCFVIISVFSAADAQWFWQNPVPQGNGLTGVKFVSANTGWAVGFYGTIIKTTDGGINWKSQFAGTTDDLFALSFSDQDNGFVVGNEGTILKTTDGSHNWAVLNSGTTSQLNGVAFSNNNNGTVVGNGGLILRTTDGGNNWISQTSGTNSDLYGVCSIEEDTETAVGNGGKIAGSYGTILRKTNGGVVFINDASSQSQPTGYLLSQNYPNPFNPATMISWQSPAAGWQTLKVYDVLGKEVSTLVDEYKAAGSYSVEFNAASLASGVYFYRLQAGNFTQTKKLILLK